MLCVADEYSTVLTPGTAVVEVVAAALPADDRVVAAAGMDDVIAVAGMDRIPAVAGGDVVVTAAEP